MKFNGKINDAKINVKIDFPHSTFTNSLKPFERIFFQDKRSRQIEQKVFLNKD